MAKGETYEEFVEKFKPKKTTDDCMTPPAVYETVKNWAVEEYELEGRPIVRPFYPGGDYEYFDYPENCVVIDNPPFSIFAPIKKFYSEKGIDFFLFAPALTLFTSSGANKYNYIITDTTVTYDNGASVKTAFVTNLGDTKILLSSKLRRAIVAAVAASTTKKKRRVINYPRNLITATKLAWFVGGEDVRIYADEIHYTTKLDYMAPRDKIFGGGVIVADKVVRRLLNNLAAKEEEKTREAAGGTVKADRFKFSDNEKAILKKLNGES